MDPVLIPDSVTFESLLTAAGAGVAAGIITGTVALINAALPGIGARVSGALLAFVLSAVLYVLTGIAVGVSTLNAGLAVFVAWLTCATAAVGVYQVVVKGALTK